MRHKDETGNCASLQLWAYVSIGRNALLLSPPLPYPLSHLSPSLPRSFAPPYRLFEGPRLPPLCKSFFHCSLVISVITPFTFLPRQVAKRHGPGPERDGLCSASQQISEPTEWGRKEAEDLVSHTHARPIWPEKTDESRVCVGVRACVGVCVSAHH